MDTTQAGRERRRRQLRQQRRVRRDRAERQTPAAGLPQDGHVGLDAQAFLRGERPHPAEPRARLVDHHREPRLPGRAASCAAQPGSKS